MLHRRSNAGQPEHVIIHCSSLALSRVAIHTPYVIVHCRSNAGQPEHVINYFFLVAEELRGIMASLGVSRIQDMVGRAELLEHDPQVMAENPKVRANRLPNSMHTCVCIRRAVYDATSEQHAQLCVFKRQLQGTIQAS